MTLPCPFCAARLQESKGVNGVGLAHPTIGSNCILNGWFFGATFYERWNTRAVKVGVYMEIVDGHPVFHETPKGEPVTLAMVNDTVAYYREQAK